MPGPYDKFAAAFETFQEELKQELAQHVASFKQELDTLSSQLTKLPSSSAPNTSAALQKQVQEGLHTIQEQITAGMTRTYTSIQTVGNEVKQLTEVLNKKETAKKPQEPQDELLIMLLREILAKLTAVQNIHDELQTFKKELLEEGKEVLWKRPGGIITKRDLTPEEQAQKERRSEMRLRAEGYRPPPSLQKQPPPQVFDIEDIEGGSPVRKEDSSPKRSKSTPSAPFPSAYPEYADTTVEEVIEDRSPTERETQEHIIHRQKSLSRPLGEVADEPQGERILRRGGGNVGVPPMFREEFGSSPQTGAKPCPSCGTQNRPDAVFCGGCGQRLAAAPQKPGTVRLAHRPQSSRQLVNLDEINEQQELPRTGKLIQRPQSRPMIQRPKQLLDDDEPVIRGQLIEDDITPKHTTREDDTDFRW